MWVTGLRKQMRESVANQHDMFRCRKGKGKAEHIIIKGLLSIR